MSATLLTGPVPSFGKKLSGYRTVGTLVGDTLQRIALRELGDASQWYDIANLNALNPPYLVDDPSLVAPGVLFAGQDTLRVPSVAPLVASGVDQVGSVFGTDCLLQGRQLQANSQGDFATVADEVNLRQALTIRLGTHPGDLVYHPEYGCQAYTLLGRGGSNGTDQLAAAFVAAAINADPRVSRAINTTATTVGDQLSATSTAMAINGKQVTVGVGNANN